MNASNGVAFTPRTCEELFGVWAGQPEARLLAGGTDLLVRLKKVAAWPPLIALERVSELRGIQCVNGWLQIRACSTYCELAEDHFVQAYAPALAEAARDVGAPAIRARGTLGGNLANASPAGDSIPPLYVADALVELRSAAGTREVPITEFFRGPGQTLLQPQELICAVRLPIRRGWREAFVRLGQRAALTIAKVSVAVAVRVERDVVQEARIALGAVAPTVIRAREAEVWLCGRRLDEKTCEAAGAAAARAAEPISDIRSVADYRRAMCAVLVREALCRVSGQRGVHEHA
ncbi:MAG: xanthine dehydrogenase family protein subunit M [bacterium]|nr:xanthine dehydrogenase family protein subunit M [bacterium]